MCCACGLCTLYACPEELFPKEACDQSKAELKQVQQELQLLEQQLDIEGAVCTATVSFLNSKASSLQELQARLSEVFSGDMQTRFISELCQLWDGQLEFSNQTYNHTLDGQRLEVHLRARILDGHEATWDRVLLTLEDAGFVPKGEGDNLKTAIARTDRKDTA